VSTDVTRWWFVRHAPVIGVTGRIYGGDDVECDVSDVDACRMLATRLPTDAVYLTSHLSRAKKTLAAIRDAGLAHPEPIEEPHLGEQSFGDWQGRTWDEMQESDPETYHAFWQDPVRQRPPGGESFADQIARTGGVMQRYTADHPGRDIVAVCHGGTIRAALSHALNLAPETGMAFTVHTLTLTVLEHIPSGLLRGNGGAWRIVGVNLPPRETLT
jgi:alpha-ribazole phosphatase